MINVCSIVQGHFVHYILYNICTDLEGGKPFLIELQLFLHVF